MEISTHDSKFIRHKWESEENMLNSGSLKQVNSSKRGKKNKYIKRNALYLIQKAKPDNFSDNAGTASF